MKPQIKLATAHTPDGSEMVLFQHDRDFLIRVNGQELMNSRQHESEQELARLGCAHLSGQAAACVLVGGLGMGYTLHQALDILGPDAVVVVSELLPSVVEWNRDYLYELNGYLLDDKRVELITGDVFELISTSNGRFDAILLDVDNGPHPMTDSGNQRLYNQAGIQACRRALRKGGLLALWSTDPVRVFERLLMTCGFRLRCYKAKAYKGSSSKPLFILVAADEEKSLPPDGEPCNSGRQEPGESRRHIRSKSG
jgi:spermidine synthase